MPHVLHPPSVTISDSSDHHRQKCACGGGCRHAGPTPGVPFTAQPPEVSLPPPLSSMSCAQNSPRSSDVEAQMPGLCSLPLGTLCPDSALTQAHSAQPLRGLPRALARGDRWYMRHISCVW